MIRLERILLPTDFSDHSRNAAKYACAFAEQFDFSRYQTLCDVGGATGSRDSACAARAGITWPMR